MSVLAGVFIFNGKPQNGAVAKLWKATGFASPPILDEAEPNVSYQVGATLTTAVSYGSDGGFRWTAVGAGNYYVSVYYDNHRAWLYFGEPTVASILTTQGDMLRRGTTDLERIAKGTDGTKMIMVAGVPTWA